MRSYEQWICWRLQSIWNLCIALLNCERMGGPSCCQRVKFQTPHHYSACDLIWKMVFGVYCSMTLWPWPNNSEYKGSVLLNISKRCLSIILEHLMTSNQFTGVYRDISTHFNPSQFNGACLYYDRHTYKHTDAHTKVRLWSVQLISICYVLLCCTL